MHVRLPKRFANEQEWRERTANNGVTNAMATLNHRAERLIAEVGGCVIVCGPPGVGKTRAFAKAAKDKREVVKCDISSSVGLAQVFHECSKKRAVTIFEDCDPLWSNFSNLQVMRRATDPDGPRRFEISLKYGVETFEFKNSTTAIQTNIDINDLRQFPAKHRPVIEALKSRARIVTIPRGRDELRDYTTMLAICSRLLQSFRVDIQNDALSFFARYAAVLPEVSPRALQGIAKERKDDPANWERHLCNELSLNGAIPAYSGKIPQIIL